MRFKRERPHLLFLGGHSFVMELGEVVYSCFSPIVLEAIIPSVESDVLEETEILSPTTL